MRTYPRTAVISAAAAVLLAGTATAAWARAERTATTRPPQSVPQLDVSRYAGTWYQIAAVPQLFEVQCKKNVKAVYSVDRPGAPGVRNSCDTWLGTSSSITGEAVPLDASNARLNVSFVNLAGGYRHTDRANYIVVGLDTRYRWAVVTDTDRRSGFVLSRTPALSGTDTTKARQAVEAAGLDPCTFRTTRQDGATQHPAPFC
ncbi:lipocalin family protein [Streptomyces sp. TRM66268-LWL]|uniref:Lipocalin family protein n=1 Tax=Streptomyces polyasparticus TaxID=2767826 RepID=A0ABR7SJU4_9ACTN|nr:lipocalin family protein [Streptomyces polyasparticus]MBC9715214.1 lipocalin family protein [Streptomyces polyasparticus]